ncbi:hypothetical protein [Calothrix sp. 336/3]|nr:hypothetical protein [Calothrix sp. 336/3]
MSASFKNFDWRSPRWKIVTQRWKSMRFSSIQPKSAQLTCEQLIEAEP